MPLERLSKVMNDLGYLVVLQKSPALGQEHLSSGGHDEFLHMLLGQSPADHNQIQLHNREPQHRDGSW